MEDEKFIMEMNRSAKHQEYLIYCTCLFVHSCFLIAFCYMKVYALMYFNIFSVVLYASGIYGIVKTENGYNWLRVAFIEMTIHAVACNLIIGYGYGFVLYGILVIPMTFYTVYIRNQVQNNMRWYLFLTTMCSACVFLSCVFSGGYNLVEQESDKAVKMSFAFNLLFCSGSLIFYSVLFVLGIRKNLIHLQEKNEELRFFANYDPLTKLRNRRSMPQIFEEYEAGNRNYCVVLGDIDDFKKINDNYSHSCGDQMLIQISEALKNAVDNLGIVCRWGGEEILLLLDCDKAYGQSLAEKIRCEVERVKVPYDDQELHASMTFGFAYCDEANNIEKLIAIADERLYEGKRNGKNQVVGNF